MFDSTKLRVSMNMAECTVLLRRRERRLTYAMMALLGAGLVIGVAVTAYPGCPYWLHRSVYATGAVLTLVGTWKIMGLNSEEAQSCMEIRITPEEGQEHPISLDENRGSSR